MPSFRKTHEVPFAPDQMFSIVADVERYPEFLPLCESLKVIEKKKVGHQTKLVATMAVGYKGLSEKFTTQVLIDPDQKEIDVAYIDGPFRRLKNNWRFTPTSDASSTTIHFFIDYEFKSLMLSLIAGAAFEKAVKNYTTAFEKRAHAIYGTHA